MPCAWIVQLNFALYIDFLDATQHPHFYEVLVALHQKPSAKNDSGEYANFEASLRQVLSVSRSEIQSKIKAAKRKKTKKTSSASRAASDSR
jgi:hypothetical protein